MLAPTLLSLQTASTSPPAQEDKRPLPVEGRKELLLPTLPSPRALRVRVEDKGAEEEDKGGMEDSEEEGRSDSHADDDSTWPTTEDTPEHGTCLDRPFFSLFRLDPLLFDFTPFLDPFPPTRGLFLSPRATTPSPPSFVTSTCWFRLLSFLLSAMKIREQFAGGVVRKCRCELLFWG